MCAPKRRPHPCIVCCCLVPCGHHCCVGLLQHGGSLQDGLLQVLSTAQHSTPHHSSIRPVLEPSCSPHGRLLVLQADDACLEGQEDAIYEMNVQSRSDTHGDLSHAYNNETSQSSQPASNTRCHQTTCAAQQASSSLTCPPPAQIAATAVRQPAGRLPPFCGCSSA